MMVAKTPNLIDLSKNRPARYGRRRRILSLFLRHLARYLLTFERTKNYLSSVEIGRERERERERERMIGIKINLETFSAKLILLTANYLTVTDERRC